MGEKWTTNRARQPDSLWPALVLLLLAVLAPTACVLWFLQQAVENHELAVRQKLHDFYRGQLQTVARALGTEWNSKLDELARLDEGHGAQGGHLEPAERFAALVRQAPIDSLLLLDARGQVTYPTAVAQQPSHTESLPEEWLEAEHLETGSRDLAAAAARYASLAARSHDPQLQARAWQAQIRCLSRGGRSAEVVPLVYERFGDNRAATATDASGRLIAPDAELLALELPDSLEHPLAATIESRLHARLRDYGTAMSAPQRRFLMKSLHQVRPRAQPFETERAEFLAASFAESRPPGTPPPGLRSTGTADLWQYHLPGRGMILLVTRQRLQALFESVLQSATLPADLSLRLVGPEDPAEPAEPPFTMAASDAFPLWSLQLTTGGDEPLLKAARQRILALWWTGALAIGTIVSLAVLLALAMRRQFALARLKNDLVATVSHELRTPLASMRLLVDTLLHAEQLDENTTRDYLRLAVVENERLSRLIENFLSFSRMTHGRQKFVRQSTTAGSIVEAAQAAAGDRFAAPACQFDVQCQAPGAGLEVDADSVVTAVLNLLDNAYKFTGEPKQIRLAAQVQNGEVCFEVSDNGIGLAPSALRRVFDQFYQVDQSLARENSGCGLGLAIVRSIVAGNGGTVDVRSQLGQGSTFTLRFPSVASQPAGAAAHATQP